MATTTLTTSSPGSRRRVTDQEHLIAALRTGAYGLVDEKGVFALFRRGAPSATAEPFLLRIGASPNSPIK